MSAQESLGRLEREARAMARPPRRDLSPEIRVALNRARLAGMAAMLLEAEQLLAAADTALGQEVAPGPVAEQVTCARAIVGDVRRALEGRPQ